MGIIFHGLFFFSWKMPPKRPQLLCRFNVFQHLNFEAKKNINLFIYGCFLVY